MNVFTVNSYNFLGFFLMKDSHQIESNVEKHFRDLSLSASVRVNQGTR